jgi:hypothetical protein
MTSIRALSALMAASLTLVACQSPQQKASQDEAKVAEGIEAVCAAQVDVNAAIEAVAALTPESTVADAEKAGMSLRGALLTLNRAENQLGRAEVREYRDQVEIFQKAVKAVRENKSLTLAEASEQLKTKVAPVIEAREQLAATTVCVEFDAQSVNNQAPSNAGADAQSPQNDDIGSKGDS